jgi:NAD(P)-dependent dehydrogenase (short-subunit alcohol dehydrogenase family)
MIMSTLTGKTALVTGASRGMGRASALALAAAGVALVAAAVTPPGQSVVNSVRDVVGREKVVGVANAMLPAGQGLGFATPARAVQALLDSMPR